MRRLCVLLAALLSAATTTLAGNQYFSSTSGSVWDTMTADWGAGSGGPYTGVWSSGNIAIFEGTAGTVTVGAGGNPTAGGITFAANNYVLTNGTINLTGTPIIDSGTNNATIYSLLAGSIGFTKKGSGTLTLSAANIYTGNTTVLAGSLRTSVTGVFSNGTVQVGANANLWFNPNEAPVSPAMTCTNNLVLSNTSAVYAGPASYSATGDTAYKTEGNVTCSGAVSISGTVTIGSAARTSLIFAGQISGSGTLTVNTTPTAMGSGGSGNGNPGCSWIDLNSPTNNWTGGTVILQGIGAYYGGANDANKVFAASLGSGPIQLGGANGGWYDGGGFLYLMAANAINPASVVTMYGGANSAYYSQLDLNGYSQTIGGLAGGGGGQYCKVLSAAGSSTLTISNVSSYVFSGVLSSGLSLVKAGSGTETLSGINTYSGTTTISGGTLVIGGAGQLGSGSYAKNITNNGALNYASSANQTFSGVISGSGSLTNSGGGALTLSATNTYTGATTISSGTLTITNAGQLGGGSYTQNILNNGTLNYASSAAQTLSGAISGSGSLGKSGSGTLTLSAPNSYTGDTTISAGVLAVSGNGTLGTNGNWTIASGATLDLSGATGVFGLGASQTLMATGGTGTINGSLSLNSAAVTMNYSNGTPTLNVTGGTFNMNNNPVTVTVAGSSSLPLGSYKLVSAGTGGTVDGTVSGSIVNVLGAGASGNCALQIVSGELYLNVQSSTPPTTITLSSSAPTQSYAQSVTFTATVSPSAATGSVALWDGTNIYSTTSLTGGQAVFTLAATSLKVGSHAMTAQYYGNASYLPSTSSVLTQVITQAVLTVVGNNATRWVGNANLNFTVSYFGLVGNDTVASELSGAPALSTTATSASPAGVYPIAVAQGTLTDVSGNYALAFTNATLTVTAQNLPYPQGTAFPLMMYEVGSATDATNLAAYGWNVIQNYGNSTNSIINSYLQMAVSNSQCGDVVIPGYGSNPYYTNLPQAQVQAWIQGSMTNNNIAWWDFPEEAYDTNPTNVLMFKNYRAWVQQYDTGPNGPRPTYEVTYFSSIAPGLITNIDIVAIESYGPGGCGSFCPSHACVRHMVQTVGLGSIRKAGATIGPNYHAGQKTLLSVLYCASVSQGNLVPTPAQSYHDFWSAIASGAQGVEIYAYYDCVHGSPASITNNLAQYNLAASQIAGSDIGQAVLFGAQNANVNFTITSGPTSTETFTVGSVTTNYPSLNVLCKTWSNNVYVIAVNSTSNYVTATITNLSYPGNSATLPFEYRTTSVTGGALSDVFAPWGVHVYKVQPAMVTLTYNAGTGGVINGVTPQTVNYGASGTAVTAVTNTGYQFVNWSDGSTANPRTDANVTNNVTVTANFVPVAVTPPVMNGSPTMTGGGGFQFSFSGASGQTYKVIGSTNLVLPLTNWAVLKSGTFAAGSVTYTNLWATNPAFFYRVVSP